MSGTSTTSQNQWNTQNSNGTSNIAQTGSQSYDPQVVSEGQNVFGNASNVSGFSPYSGPTQGQFGSQWTTATNNLNNAVGQNNPLTTAGASTLQNVINGIGANTTSQYMNPYVSATLAPTIQNLNMQNAQQQQTNAANATTAGAYGGTAQGVEAALNNYYTNQNIGNATGQAYDNAYQSAVNSQQAGNSALTSAAGGLNTIGTGQENQQNTVNSLLANLGSTQQAANQTGITNAENQSLVNNTQPLTNQSTLASVLSAIPKNTNTASNTNTQQQSAQWGNTSGYTSQPNNTGLSLLGSVLAGL